MADAVEPAWQDMEQEAANELVCRKRHDLLPFGPVATIVLVTEGDACIVEADEPAVRDGDAVSVARKIGQSASGPAKGGLA
jgi:hypothetical protein